MSGKEKLTAVGWFGRNGSGFFEAVAKFSTEGLAANELLIAAHFDFLRIGVGIAEVHGVDVDELYDEVGVRPGGRNP